MELLIKFENMKLEKEGKLAWLTFTRERYLNAINMEGTRQLERLAWVLHEDPDVRVVVIRGQGRAFSTGIDLKQLAAGDIDMTYHDHWEKALRLFETMEKIVITGLHGYCLGGALQLALAGDIRVSTADCQIGLPAIKESLIPGLGVWRLPRYIGMGRAKKMVLGGQNIDGEEALRIGLVDHVVDHEASGDDFFDKLDAVAQEYLAACSTGTRMSKLALNSTFDMNFDEFYPYYRGLQERAQLSMDAVEANRAYLEGRDPNWQ